MAQLHASMGRKLEFANHVRSDYKLLEVSEDLLSEIVTDGPRLNGQISFGNSKGVPPVTVCATNGAHIEIVEIAPKLAMLKLMIGANLYSDADADRQMGADTEMGGAGTGGGTPLPAGRLPGYTFEELLDTVQATEEEIQEAHNMGYEKEIHEARKLLEPLN
eukprot:gene20729-27544_t